MIKKADIVLFLIIVILGLAISFWSIAGSSQGDTVIIKAGGELFGTYNLDENREININDTNTVVIENGTVYMKDSTCKNHVCIDTGKISETKDSIVCLPNKVVVTIESNKNAGGDVDVISR